MRSLLTVPFCDSDTQTLVPSNSTPDGTPFTGNVPIRAPSLARILSTWAPAADAAQMFAPSNANGPSSSPDAVVARTKPSLARICVKPPPSQLYDTQMLAPSKTEKYAWL